MRQALARGTVAALAGVVCLGVAAGWVSPARAAVPTATEFASHLDQARAAVATARPSLGASGAAAGLADRVDALLPTPFLVQEGTRTIVVDLSAIADSANTLRKATSASARSTAADAIAARLTALRSAVGSVSTTAAADPSDPAGLAGLVAALPRSTSTAQDWLNRQIEKILNWIVSWLGSLGPGGAAPASAASRLTMLVVLAIPVVLALIVLVRALLARRRRATAGPIGGPDTVAGAPAVAAAADLPVDALGYAQSLAAAGAHRDAVRALYGGAARHLVEAGAVSRMRTRTNHEMLRDVAAARPALAAPFEALTSDFERAWYGHAEPGRPGFERARAVYEKVVEAATVGTGTSDAAPPAARAADEAAAPPEAGDRR
jgi:hypothetical protein